MARRYRAPHSFDKGNALMRITTVFCKSVNRRKRTQQRGTLAQSQNDHAANLKRRVVS
jgi:hypothetical protein